MRKGALMHLFLSQNFLLTRIILFIYDELKNGTFGCQNRKEIEVTL